MEVLLEEVHLVEVLVEQVGMVEAQELLEQKVEALVEVEVDLELVEMVVQV